MRSMLVMSDRLGGDSQRTQHCCASCQAIVVAEKSNMVQTSQFPCTMRQVSREASTESNDSSHQLDEEVFCIPPSADSVLHCQQHAPVTGCMADAQGVQQICCYKIHCEPGWRVSTTCCRPILTSCSFKFASLQPSYQLSFQLFVASVNESNETYGYMRTYQNGCHCDFRYKRANFIACFPKIRCSHALAR